jgi:hypothetical protein
MSLLQFIRHKGMPHLKMESSYWRDLKFQQTFEALDATSCTPATKLLARPRRGGSP